jgi:hypothetical protein
VELQIAQVQLQEESMGGGGGAGGSGSASGGGGGGSGGVGGVGIMNNTRHTNQQGDMGYSIPTNASYDFGEYIRSLVHRCHSCL